MKFVTDFLAKAKAHFSASSAEAFAAPKQEGRVVASDGRRVSQSRHHSVSTNLHELRKATPGVYVAEWGGKKLMVRVNNPPSGMRPVMLPIVYFEHGKKRYDRRKDGGFFIPHHFVLGKRPKLPDREKLPTPAQEFMDSMLLVIRSAAAFQLLRQQPR